MKTLIIDNYDSFTYNLYQFLGELSGNPIVVVNDEITHINIKDIDPTHIVISPGPGTVKNPKDFGNSEEIILRFMDKIPILGVCLGLQGIIKALGGKIEPAPKIMHGKQSLIKHNNSKIFKDVPNPFMAMRYHSLCASHQNFPKNLRITANDKDNTIMGIEHCENPLFGIQFHPESFKTDSGKQILKNFLIL